MENVTKSILVNKDSPRSAVNFASTVSATSSGSSKPGRVDGKPPGSSPAPVTPSQPIKNPKSEKIELPLKLPFLDFKESQEEAKKPTQESTKKNVEVQKVRFFTIFMLIYTLNSHLPRDTVCSKVTDDLLLLL